MKMFEKKLFALNNSKGGGVRHEPYWISANNLFGLIAVFLPDPENMTDCGFTLFFFSNGL